MTILDCPSLTTFYVRVFGDDEQADPPAFEPPCERLKLSDDELIEKMKAAQNGAKFARLWAGDTTDHDKDESAADFALLAILTFWTNRDPERMDRLFRRSGLYREKWERQDYRERTIAKAIELCRETYSNPPAEPPIPEPEPWPQPAAPEAYYGLAGEIVRLIEPHTEADSVALLIQFLVAFGNVIGRGAWFVADGAFHYLNLFAVLIGATAKGRKGTSWQQIHRLYVAVAAQWAAERILSGLSSGEGLIWAVRDPITRREPIKSKGHLTGYQDIETDPGISDKRLLVLEAEFANCLKVVQREGNNLSPIVRQAWETGALRTMTKNSPAVATGAHVSNIGHITKDELRRLLDATEVANGFANRFMWLCVRRSKVLPEGGAVETVDFAEPLRRLTAAIQFGQKAGELKRDDDARALWHQVYLELSEGKPGMFGAVTSRAEAQVMRLACIYALLDLSATIRVEHLNAALALWRYCEASARYVFGASLGDRLADEILSALRSAPAGMTRTEIRDLFGRNKSGDQIAQALGLLLHTGAVRRQQLPTGGRPVERWFHSGN